LSHHGRPRDIFRVAHDDCCFAALAWEAVSNALGAMAADVEFPTPLHCQYSRMDARRDRTSALDHLRPDANLRRLFKVRVGREQPILAAWLDGNVHRALHSFHRPGLPYCGERAAST